MTSMRTAPALCLAAILIGATALPLAVTARDAGQAVDQAMVARIRDEGLQRSRVMDVVSYITDVLGARLTL